MDMASRMVAEGAAGSLSGVYNEIRVLLGLGVVPNVFKAMAAVNADVLLQNWTAYKYTFLDGQLPRSLKEMVGLAVAREFRARYSVPLHARALAELGVPAAVVADLVAAGDSAALPGPVRAALAFARVCSWNPDGAAADSLESTGFPEEEVHELIDAVLIVLGLNAFALEAGVPADEF
jgi:alkylhydroperoxidase family enzyme